MHHLPSIVILVTGFLAVGCSRPSDPGGPLCPDCNIVMISIDTLRPDHMGVYGYDRPTTPHLDAYFPQSSVFTRATSTAPCTRPAVKQFLNGRFDPLSTPLPLVLSLAGYQTAAVVSQHQFVKEVATYSRGFDHWDLQAEEEVDQHRMTRRHARQVSRRAITWLDRSRDPEQPFFLWLHYFDPHDPYNPPPRWRRAFDPGEGPRLADGDRRVHQLAARRERSMLWFLIDDIFDEADRRRLRGLYDAEIAFVDHQVGRVLEAVGEQDLVEDTIVVLIADHGERLGEEGAWDHCYTVEEVETWIPFLFRVPGRTSVFSKQLRQQRVSSLDVMPTLLDLVGIPGGQLALDGRSLLEEGEGRFAMSVWRDTVAVSSTDHKLYCSQVGDDCLVERFVRIGDGVEEQTLPATGPTYQALLSELEARRGLHIRASEIAEESLKQLQALGYTE
ncbi:MAG: sulfatase [Deltaproteobacteria bacterium]|nr:sulfatase [Deltaproteobacteria bacterium]MBW2257264.1 sulfatase [Deltaproteobacteria bacterium]